MNELSFYHDKESIIHEKNIIGHERSYIWSRAMYDLTIRRFLLDLNKNHMTMNELSVEH